MELVPYTDADLWLTERLETDPRVMAELGGPWPPDEIPRIHERRLRHIANGAWCLTIVPGGGGRPVGAVSLWRSVWEGSPIAEIGWMVLPEHQGRGHASAAVGELLARARADGGWGAIHAFPGVSNAASNAICRKFGFEALGEVDVDYGERWLRCNHWVLDA